MSFARLGSIAVAIAAAAGAGCGDEPDEKQQVQQVVRDFATANTRSDGEAFCGLVTRDFRERLTGATGEGVDEQCVKQVDALKGRTIKVIRIDEPRVTGDTATVTAELDFSGQRQLRTLRLRREEGKFRLTEG